MAEYLVDTNVLSKYFAGDLSVKTYLESVDYAINTIIYIELIQGSIKRSHATIIKRYLAGVGYYPLTPSISATAIDLISKDSASKGLFLQDALIAATAIEHDLTVVTYNLKDFNFIDGIRAVRPK